MRATQYLGLESDWSTPMHNVFPTRKTKFAFPCFLWGGGGGVEVAHLPGGPSVKQSILPTGPRNCHIQPSPNSENLKQVTRLFTQLPAHGSVALMQSTARAQTHTSPLPCPLLQNPPESGVRGAERLYRGVDQGRRAQIRKSQTGLRLETWVFFRVCGDLGRKQGHYIFKGRQSAWAQ